MPHAPSYFLFLSLCQGFFEFWPRHGAAPRSQIEMSAMYAAHGHCHVSSGTHRGQGLAILLRPQTVSASDLPAARISRTSVAVRT